MATQYAGRIGDARAWHGADLAGDRDWERTIAPAERAELDAALAAIGRRNLPLDRVTRETFPLGPALRNLVAAIDRAVRGGRGFIVLRGIPVAGHADEDVRRMYWGLCQHLGTCVSQDPDSALVADVKERGIPKAPMTRAYGSKRETRLHVDLADVVGLLGVRQAATAPRSTLTSATAIHNAFLERHPEWLPRLYEGFHWDRFGEQAPWEAPVSPEKIPVFSFAGGDLSVRYNRNWMLGAATRRNVPFTDEEVAIFDFFDETARRNALSVEMGAGDVYFVNNYAVLHGREAYDEAPDAQAAQKRLFFRVWMYLPRFRSFADEATVRFGLLGHGNLGWTAGELAAGWNDSAGHRRSVCEPASAFRADMPVGGRV
jgi:hypothetical protein